MYEEHGDYSHWASSICKKEDQMKDAASKIRFYWNLWDWFKSNVSLYWKSISWLFDLLLLVEMRKHVTCPRVGVRAGVKMNTRNSSIIIFNVTDTQAREI